MNQKSQPGIPVPAVNVMTAGRSVPMKFSLGGDVGLEILQEGRSTRRAPVCIGSHGLYHGIDLDAAPRI